MSTEPEQREQGLRAKGNRYAKIAIGGIVAIAVVIGGWWGQRRYLPTCGQVAEHAATLFHELNPDGPANYEAFVRQECRDEDWTLAERRNVMAGETDKQVLDALKKNERERKSR